MSTLSKVIAVAVAFTAVVALLHHQSTVYTFSTATSSGTLRVDVAPLTNSAPQAPFSRPRATLPAKDRGYRVSLQASQREPILSASLPQHQLPVDWTLATALSLAAAALTGVTVKAVAYFRERREVQESLLHQATGSVLTSVVSLALASSAAAASLTWDELQSLSYNEVKGTGIASTCPVVEGSGNKLNLNAGQYLMSNLCFEPASFQVKLVSDPEAEREWLATTLLTRQTYTLSGIEADLQVDKDGKWKFQERDGLDFEALTLKLPKNPTQGVQGDRVPMLFTVKDLDAQGDGSSFLGKFNVPSYRGATFMDPKGRGAATGYETQPGISADTDQDIFDRENDKRMDPGQGTIAMKVARVNAQTGEVAGVFESIQTTDTDMGGHDANDVKVTGSWYAQVGPA